VLPARQEVAGADWLVAFEVDAEYLGRRRRLAIPRAVLDHEQVVGVVARKRLAGGEGQAERSRMGLDANRRRSDPRAILSGRLRSGGGRLAARPAEVLARLDDGDQVRRDFVALVVALVDGRPQQARAGLNG